jgi:alpha-tubulin suppressor-like RCC1 family protein
VHCNQPDPQWSELLGEAWPRYGALQLWSLDPLSGFVAQKVMEFPLSCASDPGRIVASENFSLALDNEGKVWGWGDNQKGQLGTGDNQYSSTPVAADLSALGGVPVTWLAAGRASALALDAEGRLWEWGSDEWQHTESTLSPVAVDLTPLGGSGIASIATGDRSTKLEYDLILDEEDRLWIRGDEYTASICYDTDGPAWQQVDLTALGEAKVVRMAAKGNYVLVLDNTGQLWAWGDNSSGQLGDGTTTNSCTPVAVDQSALGGWKAADVAVAYGASYAIDKSGRVWSWGGNFKGMLGSGASAEELWQRSVPGLVQLPEYAKITRMAVSSSGVLALDETGRLWGWGWNYHGELGNGTKGDYGSNGHDATQPVPTKVDQRALGDARFVDMAAGRGHSLALDDMGRLWAWGSNGYGQLGVGYAGQILKVTPVQVDDSELGDDPWIP